MIARAWLAALAFALGASAWAAAAQAPDRSLVPLARGAEVEAGLRPEARTAPASRDARPAAAAVAAALAAAVPQPATTRPASVTGRAAPVTRSLRPTARPEGLEQLTRAAATRRTPSRVAQPGVRGTLCGTAGLTGERLERITGPISGCGIAEPVRLRSVDGIALSTPATVTCDTARALQTWLRDGLTPAVGSTGGGIANLRVVASYACRTRNSQSGARLSEHARGNAIDIAGIGLADGNELTVLRDWNSGRAGRILQAAHRTACGPFGTVLGPNSDRFHQDHFHFDVASYRSGTYCR